MSDEVIEGQEMPTDPYLQKLEAQWKQLQADMEKQEAQVQEKMADVQLQEEFQKLRDDFDSMKSLSKEKIEARSKEAEQRLNTFRSKLGLALMPDDQSQS